MLSSRRTQDKTHAALRERPDMSAVLAGGVLKADPKRTAPALHAKQEALQKSMLRDQVRVRVLYSSDLSSVSLLRCVRTCVRACVQ
jgi:hypothetical protein